MNASFTEEPTQSQHWLARRASARARKLVLDYAKEVGDSHEWPNKRNVDNTRITLLAYIAGLEP
jgi:hypothetical protein